MRAAGGRRWPCAWRTSIPTAARQPSPPACWRISPGSGWIGMPWWCSRSAPQRMPPPSTGSPPQDASTPARW